MREMYYCPACKSTWSAERGETFTDCPECKTSLVKMNISKDEWDTLDDVEKSARKAALKEQKTELIYLAQIANEVKSIAFWVRLWSVLSLLSILAILLQTCR